MRSLRITGTPDCSTDSDRATEPTSRNPTDPITSEAVPCTYQLAGHQLRLGLLARWADPWLNILPSLSMKRDRWRRGRLIRWLTANSPGLNILSAVASQLRRTASAMDQFSSQV